MWAETLTMESMFEDDISILTQEALGPSEVWLDGPGDSSLGGDMCSASHFALITAYGDIKERLGGLERENATLRRRLKVYEIKVRTCMGWEVGQGCCKGGRATGRVLDYKDIIRTGGSSLKKWLLWCVSFAAPVANWGAGGWGWLSALEW